jgi:hypothetical protein
VEKLTISRCGIYCGACYIYRAERDCGEFLREVAEWQEAELDQVKCSGCGAPVEERWRNCKNCDTIKCLEEKGHQYCNECDKFWDHSCLRYNSKAEATMQRGEYIRMNMIKIRSDPEAWLLEMDKRWRCISCGEPYSWYEETCHHCGKKLNRKDLVS